MSGDPATDDLVVADLFRAHATELVRMARLFVVDRNAAEDIVQEAFIRLSSVEDHLVGREDQQVVLDALAALPLRQRDCLTLRYLLDLGIPEIAETLELSPNSVKTHLQRGLASLEQRLEGHL